MKPSLSRKAGKSHNPRPVSRSHPRPNPKQPYGCIMTGYKKHAVTCVACSTPVRHFDRIGLGRVARQALQPRSQAGDREMKEAGSGVASTGASAEGQHPAKLFHESGFSQACSECVYLCVCMYVCVCICILCQLLLNLYILYVTVDSLWSRAANELLEWENIYVLFSQPGKSPILFQPGGGDKNFSQEGRFYLAKKQGVGGNKIRMIGRTRRKTKENFPGKAEARSLQYTSIICTSRIIWYAILCFPGGKCPQRVQIGMLSRQYSRLDTIPDKMCWKTR